MFVLKTFICSAVKTFHICQNLGIASLLGPISAGYRKDDSKLISQCDLLIAHVSFYNLASSIGLQSVCLI